MVGSYQSEGGERGTQEKRMGERETGTLQNVETGWWSVNSISTVIAWSFISGVHVN